MESNIYGCILMTKAQMCDILVAKGAKWIVNLFYYTPTNLCSQSSVGGWCTGKTQFVVILKSLLSVKSNQLNSI